MEGLAFALKVRQAALDLVRTAAQEAVLMAPFDGTVAALRVDLGQVVAPGTPAITLGNLSQLQIETTDLGETDVLRVTPGQPVEITLDALPEQAFTGQVTAVAVLANDHAGDQVFKITVGLPDAAGLRWGMTANVEFATSQ